MQNEDYLTKLDREDDVQKYFTPVYIEEKDVIRTCSVCHKSYKDKRVYVNGVPSYSFALCPNCRKSYIFKFEDSER